MNLRQKLTEDLKQAMKSADPKTVGVLRLLISALNNKSIEKKGKGQGEELTDEDVLRVLMTESKKRKEANEIFTKGNRPDLADKEKEELGVIQRYLPQQMSREEVEKAVERIIEKVMKATASGGVPPDGGKIGPAMKEVMKELKGKADAGLVSEIVKSKLSE